MHKILLTALILISAISSLLAQPESDLLILEDIVILGESKAFSDSISIIKEDTNYTRKLNLETFKYKPVLNTHEITGYIPGTSEDKFYCTLSGGSGYQLNTRITYRNPDNKLLRFGADYHNQKIKKFHNNNYLSLHWLPEIKKTHASLCFLDTKYSRDSGSSHFMGGCINSANWILWSHQGLWKLTPHLSFFLYDQTYSNIENTKKELNGSLILEWKKAEFNSGFSPAYLAENLQAEMWFNIDQTGLWLAADKNHLYPSLKYSYAHSLGHNFLLLLNNLPNIDSNDRHDLLAEIHYLTINPSVLQTKALLDHSLCLQYSTDFSLKFNWNSRYLIDQYNYSYIDNYYEITYLDNWENEFSSSLEYQWRSFAFNSDLAYSIYCHRLNYVPKFTIINSLSYNYEKYYLLLSMDYNTGRQNEKEEYLDDKILIDFKFIYRLSNNLQLQVKVENIANTDYQKFDQYPDEGINFITGFNLNF